MNLAEMSLVILMLLYEKIDFYDSNILVVRSDY